jgi:hypothetical protein
MTYVLMQSLDPLHLSLAVVAAMITFLLPV